jgi:hypothetical protein
MPDEAANVATTYFEAWKANDFDTMRSLVADDVIFEGPLATLVGAEEYMKGIQGLSRVISEIVIRKVFVDGQDVLTWYDMHTLRREFGLRRISLLRPSVKRGRQECRFRSLA